MLLSFMSLNTIKVFAEDDTINFEPLNKEIYSENILFNEENAIFKGKPTEYNTEDFRFIRYEDFLTIAQSSSPFDDQILSGDHFIITEKEVWFINDYRQITKFDYINFDYTAESSYANKELCEYFGYADLYSNTSFDQPAYHKYDLCNVDSDTTIYVSYDNTIIFWENKVLTYHERDRKDIMYFPFRWKELSFYDSDYQNHTYWYSFVSDTNTVGLIKIYQNGEIDYMIYADNNEERHLFQKNNENHVDAVGMEEGFIIYYEGDKLIGSNGKLYFDFDDMPYEEKWIGDSYGVGKGFEYCQFLAWLPYETYENSSFDIETALSETGINY